MSQEGRKFPVPGLECHVCKHPFFPEERIIRFLETSDHKRVKNQRTAFITFELLEQSSFVLSLSEKSFILSQQPIQPPANTP